MDINTVNRAARVKRRRYCRYAAVILVLAVALAALAGCTRTVTVTSKYRSVWGWWYVCTGPSWYPCAKGHIWRVTQQEYNRARVGQSYTLRLP